MTYVVSDLHGALDRFTALLKKINFSDDDVMYVLGDVVDYGEASMELVADLSMRANVYPVAGEHDFLAARMLSGFDRMLNSGETPPPEYIAEMTGWVNDGGQASLNGFRALNGEQREGVLDYLCDMALFEEAEVGGKSYLMVHAGIAGYSKDRDLEDYCPTDFFSEPLDPSRALMDGTTVIVGHVPTANGKITRGVGSIFLDCGVAFGGRLGCLCLETGEEFYV